MDGQISMIDGYEYEQPSPREIANENKKLVRPQDQHGLANNGFTCKSCKFLVYHERDKRYYKCEKWHMSACSASDVRVSWPACKLFEPDDMK